MILFSSFFVAILVVLIVGGVTYIIAAKLYPANSPKVVAFAFTLGFAIARYSGEGTNFDDAYVAFGRVTGAIVGFVLLWFLLFRREVTQNG